MNYQIDKQTITWKTGDGGVVNISLNLGGEAPTISVSAIGVPIEIDINKLINQSVVSMAQSASEAGDLPQKRSGAQAQEPSTTSLPTVEAAVGGALGAGALFRKTLKQIAEERSRKIKEVASRGGKTPNFRPSFNPTLGLEELLARTRATEEEVVLGELLSSLRQVGLG